MSSIRPLFRILVALVLIASVSGLTGCRWFKRNNPYAMAPESRPLEVPPEMDAREAGNAVAENAGPTSVTRSSLSGGRPAQISSRVLSFPVAGERSAVFDRVGEALGKISGVNVVSRAQILGAFDIDYQGQKFLVRVSDAGNGSTQVAAVDPRGVPADNEAAADLIAALKASIGD